MRSKKILTRINNENLILSNFQTISLFLPFLTFYRNDSDFFQLTFSFATHDKSIFLAFFDSFAC